MRGCVCAYFLHAATSMNAESSRSHCIVTVKVTRSCPDGTVLQGKLCMVDLAGRWVGVLGPHGCSDLLSVNKLRLVMYAVSTRYAAS